ncbi:MAG: MFS transporter [Rhodobacteraceae bacterium]|nr:MFS transporter [Paracoccaceae bacterium]
MFGINLPRERRNVAVLVLAQMTIGAQMPMIFTIGGLAGQALAPNACWATLPISLIVFGSMTAAQGMSRIMQRYGRRVGFALGSLGGALGGLIGAFALVENSFPLFLLASYFTGIYMSSHGFLRFAAADTASDEFRPKAISYVMAGGLVAALVGPQLVKVTAGSMVVPFAGTYLAVVAVNLFGALIFLLLDIPVPRKSALKTANVRSYGELLRTPRIAVAIICAMVSYALMNLMMTSTPLAIVGCGFSQNRAADVVSAHVFAMFAPSFFTGHLIARFGSARIVGAGLALLTAAGVTGLAGIDLMNFFGALILLGLGWNFGFIGATAMLVESHTSEERGKVQGLNDMLVFGGVTMASLASGTLMNCTGGTAAEGWTAVNWAMTPFLAAAGGSLLWLMLRRQPAAAAPG